MTPAAQTTKLQLAFWLEAERLMYHHTNPWELDDALTAWGYTIGPCEAQDLIGLEKVLALQPDRPVPVLKRMVSEGRLGKIGGVGYYRYPGGGGAVIDPLIEDLILEEAWFGKVERSEIPDADLVTAMNAAAGQLCREFTQAGLAQDDLADLLQATIHYPEGGPLP